jgi:hypothetical protein
MTPPGHGFGTHDDRLLTASNAHQLVQASVEVRSLHIVGISAKGLVAPARVEGILVRLSQTSEGRQMKIRNVVSRKGLREFIPVEVRVTPRARHRSDIYKQCDVVRLEQRQQLFR